MTTKQIAESLEATIGQDGFAGAFRQAEQLSRADVIALAMEFASVTVRSRKAALRKIWSRHQEVVVFQAKRRATAGRVAA